MSRLAGSTLGLLTWGVFAFGGIVSWGYWPLAAGAALIGLGATIAAARAQSLMRAKPLMIPVAVIVFAGAVQLLPLPPAVVQRVSPSRELFGRNADTGAATLSIRPRETVRAVGVFVLSSLFFLGLTAALTDRDVRALALGITVLGLILAVVGLTWRSMVPKSVEELSDGGSVERPAPDEEVSEPSHTDTFGPFGNRNHFAGWMVMAGPLALASLCARGQRTGSRSNGQPIGSVSSAFRRDLMPFVASIAVIVMVIAVFVTQSRSGIACFVCGLLLMAGAIARRDHGGVRSMVVGAAACLIVVAGLASSSGSLRAALARYAELDRTEWGGRLPIWRDALRIAGDFPLTGTGLGTYEQASEVYRSTPFRQEAAHNDYLQLAAGGGLMVGIPALVLATQFAREVWRRLREPGEDARMVWIRIGAVVALGAILVQEAVEFSLQMPANLALFVVLAAVAVRPSTELPNPASAAARF